MPDTSFLPGFERRTVMLTEAERTQFLTISQRDADADIQRYIFFCVEQATKNVVVLFLDEAEAAAQMAEDVGLPEVAKKFRGVA